MVHPAEYLAAVNARLAARGAYDVHSSELRLLAAGRAYGVGPDDCACQIIADRADRTHG